MRRSAEDRQGNSGFRNARIVVFFVVVGKGMRSYCSDARRLTRISFFNRCPQDLVKYLKNFTMMLVRISRRSTEIGIQVVMIRLRLNRLATNEEAKIHTSAYTSHSDCSRSCGAVLSLTRERCECHTCQANLDSGSTSNLASKLKHGCKRVIDDKSHKTRHDIVRELRHAGHRLATSPLNQRSRPIEPCFGLFLYKSL